MAGYGSFDDVMNALEAPSQARYLVGGRFTAADLYVGSQLGWGMMFGTIEKRPAFERYYGAPRGAAGGAARRRARRRAHAQGAGPAD